MKKELKPRNENAEEKGKYANRRVVEIFGYLQNWEN